MMMTIKRYNILHRIMVPSFYRIMIHLKEYYSYPDYLIFLLSPKVPGDRGERNGQLNEIFRWEDDGGRTN